MINTEGKKDLSKPLLKLWITWVSMFGALAIYIPVCHLSGDVIKADMEADIPLELMKNILLGISAAEIVMAYFIRRIMLTPRKPLEAYQMKERYAAAAVLVSLAISESIGIYGLLLFFIGEEISAFYTFIAISATAIIFYCPKADEFERFTKYQQNIF